MSRVVNNVATEDDYSPAATIADVMGGVQVTVLVFNESVRVQLAAGYPSGAWGRERYLPPGFHVLTRRTSGVRARSAVAGSPAQVTLEVATAEEVSWGDTPPGDFHGSHTIVVDADGNPSYDFDGHVFARGLELPLGSDDAADETSRIRWVRQSDGHRHAYLLAFHNDQDIHGLVANVTAENGQESLVRIAAIEDGVNEPSARVVISTQPSPSGASVVAQANPGGVGTQTRTIVDSLGRSSFLELADGPARWRLRHVSATVDVPSIGAHSQAGVTVSLPGGTAAAGDLAMLLGAVGWANRVVPFLATPIVTTADQVSLAAINSADVAVNPASTSFEFLIVNLS